MTLCSCVVLSSNPSMFVHVVTTSPILNTISHSWQGTHIAPRHVAHTLAAAPRTTFIDSLLHLPSQCLTWCAQSSLQHMVRFYCDYCDTYLTHDSVRWCDAHASFHACLTAGGAQAARSWLQAQGVCCAFKSTTAASHPTRRPTSAPTMRSLSPAFTASSPACRIS